MCKATTRSGSQCKNTSGLIDGLCRVHRNWRPFYNPLASLWDDERDQYSQFDWLTGKPTHDKDGLPLKGKEWLRVHNKYHAAVYALKKME